MMLTTCCSPTVLIALLLKCFGSKTSCDSLFPPLGLSASAWSQTISRHLSPFQGAWERLKPCLPHPHTQQCMWAAGGAWEFNRVPFLPSCWNEPLRHRCLSQKRKDGQTLVSEGRWAHRLCCTQDWGKQTGQWVACTNLVFWSDTKTSRIEADSFCGNKCVDFFWGIFGHCVDLKKKVPKGPLIQNTNRLRLR